MGNPDDTSTGLPASLWEDEPVPPESQPLPTIDLSDPRIKALVTGGTWLADREWPCQYDYGEPKIRLGGRRCAVWTAIYPRRATIELLVYTWADCTGDVIAVSRRKYGNQQLAETRRPFFLQPVWPSAPRTVEGGYARSIIPRNTDDATWQAWECLLPKLFPNAAPLRRPK